MRKNEKFKKEWEVQQIWDVLNLCPCLKMWIYLSGWYTAHPSPLRVRVVSVVKFRDLHSELLILLYRLYQPILSINKVCFNYTAQLKVHKNSVITSMDCRSVRWSNTDKFTIGRFKHLMLQTMLKQTQKDFLVCFSTYKLKLGY